MICKLGSIELRDGHLVLRFFLSYISVCKDAVAHWSFKSSTGLILISSA